MCLAKRTASGRQSEQSLQDMGSQGHTEYGDLTPYSGHNASTGCGEGDVLAVFGSNSACKTLVGDWVFKGRGSNERDTPDEQRADNNGMYNAMDKLIRIFHDPNIPDPPRAMSEGLGGNREPCNTYKTDCKPQYLGGWSFEIHKCDLAKYPDKDAFLSSCTRKGKKTSLTCRVDDAYSGVLEGIECFASYKYKTGRMSSDKSNIKLSIDRRGADFCHGEVGWKPFEYGNPANPTKECFRVKWFGHKQGSFMVFEEAMVMPLSNEWVAPTRPSGYD